MTNNISAQKIFENIELITRTSEERKLLSKVDELQRELAELRTRADKMKGDRQAIVMHKQERAHALVGEYLFRHNANALNRIVRDKKFAELFKDDDAMMFDLPSNNGQRELDFGKDDDDHTDKGEPLALAAHSSDSSKTSEGKGKSIVGTVCAAALLLMGALFGRVAVALAPSAAVAAETTLAPITVTSEDKTVLSNDAFEVLLDRYGDVIGWSRKPDPIETGAVQLPSRSMKTDDQGNTVIEIEDFDSMIYDRRLMEVERMPQLRRIDESAMQLAKAYDSAESAPRPYMQNNGRINFYFGTMNPRLICRPLRLTDIELEPGEQIKNLHISDTARWSVSTAWSGGLDALVTHVVVKPQIPDIAANLLIHTNVRTYSIELVSITEGQYMPFVGFIYPEIPQQTRTEDEAAWQKLLQQYNLANNLKSANEERERIQNARLSDPAEINTNYTIKVTQGDKHAAWKPLDAYDAGGKTYIVMPDETKVTEAPTFFIKANGREKLANYRVQGNKYIVGRIFDIGILQIGKNRVAIYRNKKK